ncbi:MAG: alpha/beta fold hydrolase [Thermoanaerobaculia bacterium]|nr:alpha/beta fold hydrolase [Thermoanaerobaculia bacterium]
MRIFLPHGMGRSPASMWPLALRLKRAGYRPSLFGYFVAFETFDQIVERFLRQVNLVLVEDLEAGKDVSRWGVVGHSLGNIITRKAYPSLPVGFSRFIMLAPPNQPPAAARSLRNNFFFKTFTRNAGQTIADPSFYDELPVPDVPSLVVAGDAGPRFGWLPFDGPHDAVVQVDETRLDDIPVLRVPAMHTFMMNRQDVTDAILDFLEHGNGERVLAGSGHGNDRTAAEA